MNHELKAVGGGFIMVHAKSDCRRKCVQVAERLNVLSTTGKKLHDAMLKRAKLIHGVAVGDIVESKGHQYLVTGLYFLEWGRPWIEGKLKRVNGEWSIRTYALYTNWKVVSSAV